MSFTLIKSLLIAKRRLLRMREKCQFLIFALRKHIPQNKLHKNYNQIYWMLRKVFENALYCISFLYESCRIIGVFFYRNAAYYILLLNKYTELHSSNVLNSWEFGKISHIFLYYTK